MDNYLKLMNDVLMLGHESGDRTGTGTLSLFGKRLEFDLRQGFPLVTTKKMAWKATVSELLFFISGSTDERYLAELRYGEDRSLLKDKRTIWTANCESQGVQLGLPPHQLGDSYGKQLRRYEAATPLWGWVTPRLSEDGGIPEALFYDTLLVVEPAGEATGSVRQNKKGLEYIVGGLSGGQEGNNLNYHIKFKESGYTTIASSASNPADYLHKSSSGVGYLGQKRERGLLCDRAKSMWDDMLKRCYSTNSSSYPAYGGKGITVCKKWHNFNNFYKDLSKLPGYENWMRDGSYQLDKDYYGSGQYGPNTCVFLDRPTNQLLGTQNKLVELEGVIYRSQESLADYLGVAGGTVHNFLVRGLKTRNKLLAKAKYAVIPEGKIYRPFLFIDQLQNSIDLIKEEPTSRRNVISLWNAGDMLQEGSKVVLPSCHGSIIQFYVRNNTLSCMVTQRSADLYLGLPINIASYALLTHMVAQVTGIEVGMLIMNLGDTHIYKNHIPQCKEQMTRCPIQEPKLKLNPKIDNIHGFSMDSIELLGYNPYPAIKAEMAV